MQKLITKNMKLEDFNRALFKQKSLATWINRRIDYDSICSALVMKWFLKQYSIDLDIFYNKKFPDIYKKILDKYCDTKQILEEQDPRNMDLDQYSAVLVMDLDDGNKISEQDNFTIPSAVTVFNIDHHDENNLMFGTFNYVKKRTATCLMIYDLIEKAKIAIPPQIAHLLLIAILDDSDFLRYDKVIPRDFNIVSKLLRITKTSINEYVYLLRQQEPKDSLNVQKILFNNYQFKDNFVYSYITLEEKDKSRLSTEIISQFSPVDLLRNVENIDFCFFIHQRSEQTFSVALRSRSRNFDVLEILNNLPDIKGGGHSKATGMLFENVHSIDEIVKRIQKANQEYLKSRDEK